MDDSDLPKGLRITKLRGPSNWATWKWDITVALRSKGLWRYVQPNPAPTTVAGQTVPAVTVTTTTPPTLTADELEDKNSKSLAIISFSIEDGQKLHIRGCETGKAAWAKLLSIYDSHNPATQMTRRYDFFGLRMDTEESISAWISRVSADANECLAVGCVISDDDIATVILKGLTLSYDVVRSSINANATINQVPITLVSVQQALLAEESLRAASYGETATAFRANRQHRSNSNNHYHSTQLSNSSDAPRRDPDDICRWCAKRGHWEVECKGKAAGKPRASNEKMGKAFTALAHKGTNKQGKSKSSSGNANRTPSKGSKGSTDSNGVVFTAIARHAIANLHGRFIDSGATEHLIIDRSGFTTYTPIPPLTITLGGQDSTVQAIGRGSVTFTSPVDGVAQSITLTDALHVPKAEAKPRFSRSIGRKRRHGEDRQSRHHVGYFTPQSRHKGTDGWSALVSSS